jgi:hypothetical protein
MNPNNFGQYILMIINSNFPGGLIAFDESGGKVSTITFEEDSALIYHPEMPAEFVAKIEALNRNTNFNINLVSDYNFKDMPIEDIISELNHIAKDVIEKYQIDFILFNPINPLILYVTLPEIFISENDINDIAKIIITRLPSLVRGIIKVGELYFPFSPQDVYKQIKIEPERHVPTSEDITDLKILLNNSQDVNDVIKNL